MMFGDFAAGLAEVTTVGVGAGVSTTGVDSTTGVGSGVGSDATSSVASATACKSGVVRSLGNSASAASPPRRSGVRRTPACVEKASA